MANWKNWGKIFGTEDETTDENGNYDEETEIENEEPRTTQVSKESSGVASVSNLEMKVCKPTKYDDVAGIAAHLLQHKTVVLNLEGANRETAIRLIDFLSGVTFAINGQIKNVASSTYIITPDHVEVTGEQSQPKAEENPQGRQPREFF